MLRVSGSESDKVTGVWKKIHIGEHYNVYSSPNIRLIKSRRVRWTECRSVARMRDEKCML
jgi:hypothetical protein